MNGLLGLILKVQEKSILTDVTAGEARNDVGGKNSFLSVGRQSAR